MEITYQPADPGELLEHLLKKQRPELSAKEVAKMWGCARTMIYKLADEGELEEIRIGRSRKITRRSLLMYLVKNWSGNQTAEGMIKIMGAWLQELPTAAVRAVGSHCLRLIEQRTAMSEIQPVRPPLPKAPAEPATAPAPAPTTSDTPAGQIELAL